MVVVADPILVPRGRPGRLNPAGQAPFDQRSQRVVHRLPGDRSDALPHVVRQLVRRGVRVGRHGPQDGQPLGSHLQVVPPQEPFRVLGHHQEVKHRFWTQSSIRRDRISSERHASGGAPPAVERLPATCRPGPRLVARRLRSGSSRPSRSPRVPRRRPLAGLVFVSGAASLVYEVLWLKELSLLFGSTAYAASTTLAVFFLGLAVGGAVFGRWSPHLRSPLRAYAWLELGVAASAAAVLRAARGRTSSSTVRSTTRFADRPAAFNAFRIAAGDAWCCCPRPP